MAEVCAVESRRRYVQPRECRHVCHMVGDSGKIARLVSHDKSELNGGCAAAARVADATNGARGWRIRVARAYSLSHANVE
jgi:hypothetical protein